jgi:hypothetical protein
MNDTYTHDQVTDIVKAIVGGFRHAGANEVVSYPLEKIHDLTGWSITGLTRICRAKKARHTKFGNTLGMTPSQLAELLEAVSVDIANESAAPRDEMAAARALTRKAAARKTSKSAA